MPCPNQGVDLTTDAKACNGLMHRCYKLSLFEMADLSIDFLIACLDMFITPSCLQGGNGGDQDCRKQGKRKSKLYT